MNITELSEEIKVNSATIRKWEKDFNLDISRDKKGQRLYTSKDIELFIKIRDSRTDGNGIETINKKLGLDASYIEHGLIEKSDNNIFNEKLISKLNTMENILISKIDSIQELSEKYSRATFEIGKLQAEKTGLEDKLKLISNANEKDIQSLQNEIKKIQLSYEELDRKNQKVMEENLNLKRTWFQKLTDKLFKD